MIPDRFYIDKKDRELYDKIEKEDMFEGKTRKEQFLFAMAIGFINETRRPLTSKEGFFLIKDLRPEDEALINAVAISKEPLVCLTNKVKVFEIAEEYAHAGIYLLVDKIESTEFGTFWKRFEMDLYRIYERNISEPI